MQELFDLTGRVAAVTGGGSGIGREIALALGGAGAAVVVAGRRSDKLTEAVAAIEKTGSSAAAIATDLSNYHDIGAAAESLTRTFGAPDILVNAAGINLRQSVTDITPEDWDRTLAINLATPFFLARSLVPTMRRKGWGRIINIASLQSERAFPNGLAYGASKGGIAQLTRAMAEAWSKEGITCNAIAPGFFPTELTASVFEDREAAARNAAQTCMGRNGVLEDLAGPAFFLASPASDYVTGQVLYVDGGFTAK